MSTAALPRTHASPTGAPQHVPPEMRVNLTAEPRASYLQSRRRRVQLMTIRGLAEEQIALVAGLDEVTVRQDQLANAEGALGKEPLAEERARLLAAAKQVEQAAWQIFRDLP